MFNTFIADQGPLLAESGLKISLLDDQTVPTKQAIGVMERNALQGLLFVLVICWLFLGSRIALLVGLGIPFSLAATFIVLKATGNTINVSVLLGLVISLGMLVDDAVVIVEAIYYRLQRGEAAIDAAVGVPLLGEHVPAVVQVLGGEGVRDRDAGGPHGFEVVPLASASCGLGAGAPGWRCQQ